MDDGSPSLFTPSPWAFAIWWPIFLGELVYSISSFFAKGDKADLIRRTAPGFIVSQVFQTLWAASFRPKYYESKSLWHRFVSTAMLSGIALSLNESHKEIAESGFTGEPYRRYCLPLALHFGWTTAASLVDLNGSLATCKCSEETMVAVGYASALAAAALGATVSLTRQAPVYGLVISWALTACAASPSVVNKVKQIWLCAGGAVCSGVAAIVARTRGST